MGEVVFTKRKVRVLKKKVGGKEYEWKQYYISTQIPRHLADYEEWVCIPKPTFYTVERKSIENEKRETETEEDLVEVSANFFTLHYIESILKKINADVTVEALILSYLDVVLTPFKNIDVEVDNVIWDVDSQILKVNIKIRKWHKKVIEKISIMHNTTPYNILSNLVTNLYGLLYQFGETDKQIQRNYKTVERDENVEKKVQVTRMLLRLSQN